MGQADAYCPPQPPPTASCLCKWRLRLCVIRLFQPPGGVPGTQPLLPNSMDPTRQQGRRAGSVVWTGVLGPPLCSAPNTTHLSSHTGHPNMGGSMQRMNPPRGMGPMGPGPQVSSYLSVCPSVPLPSVCPRLLSFFHSLSVSTLLALS